MTPEIVRLALHQPGLTAGERVLLAHMADRAADNGEFYEHRPRTAFWTGLNEDTIKRHLRKLRDRGLITELAPARAGKHPRRVKLTPERWQRPRLPPDLAPPTEAAPPAVPSTPPRARTTRPAGISGHSTSRPQPLPRADQAAEIRERQERSKRYLIENGAPSPPPRE